MMVFSHRIQDEATKALNQKSSGRCWIFAALNALRVHMIRKYKLDESFEFSQTYLFWADKLEKSNYFLEAVLETLQVGSPEDKALDGRLFQWLLHAPVQDGGQWDMLVALIRKYGLLPKTVFPEAFHSGASAQLNSILTGRLREFARELVELYAKGISGDALRQAKTQMLLDVYRIVTVVLGDPPRAFDWAFRDKEKAFKCFEKLTPQTFAEEFAEVTHWIYPCVSLIHDPRNPYMQTYTVRFLGNVWESPPVLYVNVPIERIEEIARIEIVEKNKPVWFGCDVGKRCLRSSGILSTELFDFEGAFGQPAPGVSTKADRLRYGDSAMTHAMVLTGVNIATNSAPTHWRVENSWGDESGGDKGFFSMSAEWFREYVYQIVVDRETLPEDIRFALEKTTPVVLPPWDPMGALAQ